MVFAAAQTHFSRKNNRLFILMELRSINSRISTKIKAAFVAALA